MKKIISFTLVMVMILSLAVTAYASDGSRSSSRTNWWGSWWGNYEPADPTEPTEPEAAVLGVPTVTDARFYHSGTIASLKNRLQISWNAVENATAYEVEITKANGETQTYTVSGCTLMVKNAACPKVYVEATSTWTAAEVRVRAIADDMTGDWSAPKNIGCDKLH